MSESIDFETETPTHEALRDRAAERVAHYFRGIALQPFSLGRQLAIERMGASGSEVENALTLVFMCTLSGKEVDRLTRTPSGWDKFRELMEAFGEQHGISIAFDVTPEGTVYANDETRQLVAVANEIWEEMSASRFKVGKPSEGPADPNG